MDPCSKSGKFASSILAEFGGYSKITGTYIAGLSDPVCSQSQLLFDGVGLWQWLMAKKTHIVKF